MGFDLNGLVNRWIYSLMPMVIVRRKVDNEMVDALVPLTEKWEIVSKIINSDSPQAKKHREKLFGHDSKIKTGDLFGEIALGKRDGMPSYHELKELTLTERAKYIAFATLDNMKELIERHDGIMKDNKKAELERHKSKHKSKKRR